LALLLHLVKKIAFVLGKVIIFQKHYKEKLRLVNYLKVIVKANFQQLIILSFLILVSQDKLLCIDEKKRLTKVAFLVFSFGKFINYEYTQ